MSPAASNRQPVAPIPADIDGVSAHDVAGPPTAARPVRRMDPTNRAKFDDPELGRQIQRLRAVDNRTNLLCLAREYLGIAAVITGTVAFAEYRAGWGLPWA